MDSVRDTPKGGFPHSEILGSKPTPGSPKLIAGCHVLHRLLTPRHPPDALLILASPAAGENPPDGTMLRIDALPSGPARLRTSRAGQLHVRFFCRRGGDEADRFTLTYSRCQTANGSSRPQGAGPEVQQCWIGYPGRSKRRWWRRTGSNRRPSACKADALPAELRPLEAVMG